MSDDRQTSIESTSQFAKTPAGVQQLWSAEITAAQKTVDSWHRKAEQIVKKFRCQRGKSSGNFDVNLFTSNVQTLRALLYGNVPQVNVTRRFEDQNDDAARVASEMLERLLNTDIQATGDSYAEALTYALDDRLLAGLGNARIRYEVEFEGGEESEVEQSLSMPGMEVEVEAQYGGERKVPHSEQAVVDYVHWKDFLWSPARTWGEVRWVAYRAYMTKDQVTERFGEDVADEVSYVTQNETRSGDMDQMNDDPWQRAEVWEVWCRETKNVYWYCKGAGAILDEKEDPLELDGFFPSPMPLIANATTSGFIPQPEYIIAQDLYMEVDLLSKRIALLTKAVKAVGVYDASSEGVKRMMNEGVENELIPVDSWAALAEKGGLQGVVDWMPLADIVAALDKLRDVRKETIEILYQVTGMSDIMRGAASTAQAATATEQSIKAKFASVRVASLQNSFARFAADLQRLKAEVIIKHFDDQTIIERSNMSRSLDAELIPAALEVLHDRFGEYRVEVESDQVSLTDYTQMKQERTEYLQAIGGYLQSIQPLVQLDPSVMPMALSILQWGLVGYKGARSVEGIMDKTIQQITQSVEKELAQKEQQQPQQDPAVAVEQAKAQSQMQLLQAKTQASMQTMQAKQQAVMMEMQAKAQADMQKMMTEHQNDMKKLEAELATDLEREQQQSEMNVLEENAKADARIREKVSVAQLVPQTRGVK